jgi:hypothetical protein
VRTGAKDLDGIELVATEDGVLALWSEQGGWFARKLDKDGNALGKASRLGARCEGGIDAARDGDAVEVACLVHPERGKHDAPGGVVVQRVGPQLTLERSRMFGRAGSLSAGIAMARGRRGLELAWHDASPDAQRVWWTVFGSSTVMSWAENWIEGGELLSRIVYWDRRSARRTLVPVVHVAAAPQLFAMGDRLVLGFRDRRPGAKTGLYLSRIGPRGQRAPAAVRIGRADGVGRPALEPCMGGVVAATPRTYGGDYFVGVNWLDRDLRRARGEQQFYEDAHAFTQVAVACVGSHAVLLIAEFPQLQRDSMALRAVPYSCR